jgi:hypothetical protein
MPALLYDPRSRGAEAYFALTEELLSRSQVALAVGDRPREDDGGVRS